MVQKFYAIKNEKAIHTGTVISTVFAVVVSGGCYFLGGFGRLFCATRWTWPPSGYDAIIPTMLSGLPDILIAVVVILVLSASMSTLSSLVLASSSTLTLDLLQGQHHQGHGARRGRSLIMRCLIVVFIAISVVIAIVQYTLQRHLHRPAHGRVAGAPWPVPSWPPSCTACTGSERPRPPAGCPSCSAPFSCA